MLTILLDLSIKNQSFILKSTEKVNKLIIFLLKESK